MFDSLFLKATLMGRGTTGEVRKMKLYTVCEARGELTYANMRYLLWVRYIVSLEVLSAIVLMLLIMISRVSLSAHLLVTLLVILDVR